MNSSKLRYEVCITICPMSSEHIDQKRLLFSEEAFGHLRLDKGITLCSPATSLSGVLLQLCFYVPLRRCERYLRDEAEDGLHK